MKVSKEKREETKRKESFYAKKSEIKSAFHTNKPMFVLLYKETLLNINDLDSYLPRVVSSLLQEFEYVFPEDDPCGLAPEETKEIQCQLEELISPCVLHIPLIPKKDRSWRMCIYFCAINNIMFKIRGRIFSRKGGMMRIKAQRIRFKFREQGSKKLQDALNGLVKEFFWANPEFKEEPKSNKAFEGIKANKEVQMSINIIMAIDGNNPHDFGN